MDLLRWKRVDIIIWILSLTHLAHGGQVVEVGNQLLPSDKGVDETGKAFLMHQPVPAAGVVIAFNAYFRNRNPATVQVWRPAELGATEKFELVSQVVLQPVAINVPVKVNWTSFNPSGGAGCIQVEPGDRLGLLVDVAPSALTYEWDFNKAFVMVYSSPVGSPYPSLGQQVTFDALNFPFHFSLSADIDIGFQDNQTKAFRKPTCSEALFGISGPTPSTTAAPTSPPTPAAPIPGPPGPPGQAGLNGTEGKVGPIGPTGPAGPIGLQGPKGNPGSTGPEGERGLVGPQGPAGPFGPTGDVGPAGPPGIRGLQGRDGQPGIPGEAGSPGLRGPPGPVGNEGPTGPRGTDGSLGRDGSIGPSGPMGPRGDAGIAGPPGLPGAVGLRGETGLQGLQGLKGVAGPPGPEGPTGPTGPQGLMGPSGPAGPPGPPGTSASGTSAQSGASSDPAAGASTGGLSSTSMVNDAVIILLVVWNSIISLAFILLCCVLFRQKRFPSPKVMPCYSEPGVIASHNLDISVIEHPTPDPYTPNPYTPTPYTPNPYDKMAMTPTPGRSSFDYKKVVHEEDSEEEVNAYKVHKRPFRSQRSSTRLDNHYEVAEEGVESSRERPVGDDTERRRRKKKHHRRDRASPEKMDQTLDTTRTPGRRYMDESAVSTRHVALSKKALHVTYSDDALEETPRDPRDPKADGTSSKGDSERGSHKYVR